MRPKTRFDRPQNTPDDSWVVSETVGNYKIVGSLGVGGMGTVFRAEHVLIGRPAAVKLLNPEMTANRDVVQRFFNEARATSAIKHPGIVEIFDFGYTAAGHAFIVMELLEGEPLTHRIRARSRMSEAEAALLMRDVCGALAAAHAKGIVHRDLKPDNIFIVPDPELGERTKILDFGIAKLTDIGLASSTTKTGSVMGTPTYMSPEQCRGSGTVDHRADLYSIGCMLYEMVAGRPPFTNPGAGELIGSHLFVEPEPLSRHAAVSAELEALVMTLLAKDPERRVQTARELGNHLLALAQATGVQVRMSGASLSIPSASGSMSAQNPTPAHLTPAHFTPSQFTPYAPTHLTPAQLMPAHLTPAHLTPGSYTPAGPSMPTFAAEKPTTLSGTASESMPVPAKKRKVGFVIAALVIVLGAGVGGFLAMQRGGGDDNHAAIAPTPPVADKPVVDPPPQPIIEPPPPVDAAPVNDVTTDPPVVDPPVTDTPVTDKPVADKRDKPKPKPDKPKPRPDKPKPKPSGDLLETDI